MDPLFDQLEPVGLRELDERAALLNRVDHKYLVKQPAFKRLLEELAGDHQALEIDGRRLFSYESVYFDTPDLRCFRDHADGRHPRFKARSRYYRDSGKCNFEVKLKLGEDQTDKRQIDYPADERERIGPDAERCLAEALSDADLANDEPLVPTLRTAFRRATLVARERADRLTCDFEVRLERFGGGERKLTDEVVLVETKSEAGRSGADTALRSMGLSPVSLSKYRMGVGMLSDEGRRTGPTGTERFFS